MKIKLLTSRATVSQSFKAGEIIEVDDREGEAMVRRGDGTLVPAPKPETSTDLPTQDEANAARPAPRARNNRGSTPVTTQ